MLHDRRAPPGLGGHDQGQHPPGPSLRHPPGLHHRRGPAQPPAFGTMHFRGLYGHLGASRPGALHGPRATQPESPQRLRRSPERTPERSITPRSDGNCSPRVLFWNNFVPSSSPDFSPFPGIANEPHLMTTGEYHPPPAPPLAFLTRRLCLALQSHPCKPLIFAVYFYRHDNIDQRGCFSGRSRRSLRIGFPPFIS